jgi:putative glutamine amidotransferase
MSLPVIGITTSCGPDPNDGPGTERIYVNRLYADCLLAAGAVPILLTKQTPPETVVELVDGLLIPGGDDIDAVHFGQQNHPAVKLEDPGRYPYEKSLLDALPESAPVLGICYGCQAINVYRGGGVIQHIPDSVPGSEHTGGALQEYSLDASSKLAGIVGSGTARGKSYHHQANEDAGRGLKIVGRSSDGIIEAIEDSGGRWVIGVQWHPERTPDDPGSVRLFRAFVEAAQEHRLQKGK